MSLKLSLPQGFSFLKSVGWFEDRKIDSAARQQQSPTLKLLTDKEVYRPGDSVNVTIEISSPAGLKDEAGQTMLGEDVPSLLLDSLSFELKGIEKLDSQWFSIPKPLPGSKQRRGERLFLDNLAPSLVSKVIIAPGQTKAYIVRVELPKILPPSYRGVSIRYIYYVRSALFGRSFVLGNGDQNKVPMNSTIQMEAHVPLQIQVSQKSSTLLNEEGILPLSVDQPAIFWREKDEDSEWTKANDNTDLEEGYDSSKDEVASVSSYNPSQTNPEFSLRNSLSTQSLPSRLSTSDPLYNQVQQPNVLSYSPIPRLSVSEISEDPDGDPPSNGQRVSPDSDRPKDDVGLPLTPKHVEPAGSEGLARGRSYNIRIDDQVLLRFSPKNSDSTYYFGDMIGGALTFFHGTGTRRCFEVSITLETSETINPRALHPSRKSSPTITKVKIIKEKTEDPSMTDNDIAHGFPKYQMSYALSFIQTYFLLRGFFCVSFLSWFTSFFFLEYICSCTVNIMRLLQTFTRQAFSFPFPLTVLCHFLPQRSRYSGLFVLSSSQRQKERTHLGMSTHFLLKREKRVNGSSQ